MVSAQGLTGLIEVSAGLYSHLELEVPFEAHVVVGRIRLFVFV